MKKLWVITLFPQFFEPLKNTGVVGSALRGERGSLPEISFINPSDFSKKGFKGVDASPYGGGAGQVMRGDVLEETLLKGIFEDNYQGELKDSLEVIYLGPRGDSFNQNIALEFSNKWQGESRDVVFICGRYEGVDERFLDKYVTRHLSLGDFVLSGGELALLPILDSIFRLMPGVLGNSDSPIEESFNGQGLEFPQYTKPQEACGGKVPEILLGGNHAEIRRWRENEREKLTRKYRPDLLDELVKREKK